MSAQEKPSEGLDAFTYYVLSDLIEVVYDGFGGAAKYRSYLVGRDLLKHMPVDVSGMDMNSAIKTVLSFVRDSGIVGDADFSISEPVLELTFRNCKFSKIIDRLKRAKVPLFICPCANVCLGMIESKFGIETEIISIEHSDGVCKVRAYLFK